MLNDKKRLEDSNHLQSDFYRDIRIGHPLFKNFDNNEKTLFVFDNVDPDICRLSSPYMQSCVEYRQKLVLSYHSLCFDFRFVTNNVGNTMQSRGNTEIKLLTLSSPSICKFTLIICRQY